MFILLLRKGFRHHEYFNSWDMFNQKYLPSAESVLSESNNVAITGKESTEILKESMK